MKKLLLIACMLMIPSIAGAADNVLAVDLTWRHVPRSANEDTKMQADLPNAIVIFTRVKAVISYNIIYRDTGQFCWTIAPADQFLYLTCGGRSGSYNLSKQPGKNAKMDWIQAEPPTAPTPG